MLELKKNAEQCELCKEVNEFLESLVVFHKGSNVVNNTYRKCVSDIAISGGTAVIRVNRTRWVSHTLHALRNFLNGLKSHIACYGELRAPDNYFLGKESKMPLLLDQVI